MHTPLYWLGILATGTVVGFLGGMFGKGGSSLATPVLAAIGVPPIVAVASPLPATVPGTLAALVPYVKRREYDRSVIVWGIAIGLPSTVIGAVLTRWVDGRWLVVATDVFVAGLGLRFLVAPRSSQRETERSNKAMWAGLTAAGVGLVSGLLANAGGFLLVPLYMAFLRLPVRKALGSSLAVASMLAIPGTAVHAWLGHIDWLVVVVFGMASVPLSAIGARTALRIEAHRMERIYGGVLFTVGLAFLASEVPHLLLAYHLVG